jgi:hypothetical protein
MECCGAAEMLWCYWNAVVLLECCGATEMLAFKTGM